MSYKPVETAVFIKLFADGSGESEQKHAGIFTHL